MYRRAFQTLLYTAFRPSMNIHSRLNFHLMKNVLRSKSPSLTTPVEEKMDFSDLSSEQFGTLRSQQRSIKEKMEELPAEEGDVIEFDVTNEEGRKNRKPKQYYEKLIENLLVQNKLVEALDVLETRIIKTDRIKPWYRVFNLLINGCARAGYSEKAFELHRRMKERQVKCTPATYTGLFNACANSPFPEDAARRLASLRKSLAETGVELTAINYHAMIKAYARLKNPYAAFLVADEMVSKGHAFNSETCAFLLQACISDSEAGLRHALLLWHKMRSRKITPSLYAYNLFLRCVRDCEFGTEKDLQNILHQISEGNLAETRQIRSGHKNSWSTRISWKLLPKELNKRPSEAQHELKSENTKTDDIIISQDVECNRNKIEVSNQEVDSEQDQVEIVDVPREAKSEDSLEIKENKPNLLAAVPHLGSIIAVKDVKTASDRLLLLGGLKTILEQMKNDGIKPDIKTFTLLLDVTPATDAVENQLLEEIKNHNVYFDIDFCNMLMKKRAMRSDYKKAREVLNIIQSNYLQPDIVTFGILAMSCSKVYEAEEIIFQLQDFGYRLNMPILGAMLSKACYVCDFNYLLYIMKLTQRIKIPVSEEYMQTLRDFDSRVSKILRSKKYGDKTVSEFFRKPSFLENYRMWKDYYGRFKKEVNMEILAHPYKQFHKSKVDSLGDVENDGQSTQSEISGGNHYSGKNKGRTNFIRRKNERTIDDDAGNESSFTGVGKRERKFTQREFSGGNGYNFRENRRQIKFTHQKNEMASSDNTDDMVNESSSELAEDENKTDSFEKPPNDHRRRRNMARSWRRRPEESEEQTTVM